MMKRLLSINPYIYLAIILLLELVVIAVMAIFMGNDDYLLATIMLLNSSMSLLIFFGYSISFMYVYAMVQKAAIKAKFFRYNGWLAFAGLSFMLAYHLWTVGFYFLRPLQPEPSLEMEALSPVNLSSGFILGMLISLSYVHGFFSYLFNFVYALTLRNDEEADALKKYRSILIKLLAYPASLLVMSMIGSIMYDFVRHIFF